MSCSLESRELLAVCLKKLKGLSKVHLVDAGFIWTEPHSKRVKVKITIQKEVGHVMSRDLCGKSRGCQVLSGAILQQVFVVEFTVHHQMCDECHRREARDFWRALVQVRQKVRETFNFHYQLPIHLVWV